MTPINITIEVSEADARLDMDKAANMEEIAMVEVSTEIDGKQITGVWWWFNAGPQTYVGIGQTLQTAFEGLDKYAMGGGILPLPFKIDVPT